MRRPLIYPARDVNPSEGAVLQQRPSSPEDKACLLLKSLLTEIVATTKPLKFTILGGVETLLGTITNAVGQQTILTSSAFEYIELRDVTKALFPKTRSYNGFDVSAIKISVIPLPAAGTMLLAGLDGLAALRRRKNLA